jgi:type III pantothenate kinase
MTDLLVDIGNTRLKWRLQEQGTVQCSGAMPVSDLSLAQLQAGLPESVTGVYWASVAGDEKGRCLEAWAQQKNVQYHQVTTQDHWQGLINGYQQTQQLGVDRWLAMVAARQYAQSAVCVVDCGSAITFDYVTAEGCHEGSYIIPGARLMSQALARDTAQINVTHQTIEDVRPGTNTTQAVLAGCYQMAHHGACGLVREAQGRGYQILVCGGDGLVIANELGLAYVAELVLDGLAQVAGLPKH